jgi:hypothetical protein
MYNHKLRRARNPNTNASDLHDIAGIAKEIDYYLVRNPKTSKETILKMYESNKSFDVCHSLAIHPNTPSEILCQLADIEAYALRVAKNPNTKQEILGKLASSIQRSDDDDFKNDLAKSLAKNINTPTNILQQIIFTTGIKNEVYAEIAANQNASEESLDFLSNKSDKDIKKNVMNNPRVNKELKERLKIEFKYKRQSKSNKFKIAG